MELTSAVAVAPLLSKAPLTVADLNIYHLATFCKPLETISLLEPLLVLTGVVLIPRLTLDCKLVVDPENKFAKVDDTIVDELTCVLVNDELI